MIVRFAAMGMLVTVATVLGLSAPSLLPHNQDSVVQSLSIIRTFRSDFIPVPHINASGVQGYFIGRFNLHYDASGGQKSSDLIKAQLHHSISQFFYENGENTFWLGGSLTPEKISQALNEALSTQLGKDTIQKFEIRQTDYLLVNEVRRPVIEF